MKSNYLKILLINLFKIIWNKIIIYESKNMVKIYFIFKIINKIMLHSSKKINKKQVIFNYHIIIKFKFSINK
jgi:hypothetical protein